MSPSQTSIVKRYIANQKKHHGKQGFEEELITLLERAGVPFDRGEIFA